MKPLSLALIMTLCSVTSSIFGTTAYADAECGGYATDGSFVTISVGTTGKTATPERGEVAITSGRNTFGYKFAATDIKQYFENEDREHGEAVVGLVAFEAGNNPLNVKYVGENFVDQDLRAVADARKAAGPKAGSNVMRIWKGPRYEATEQYQINDVMCAVWTAI